MVVLEIYISPKADQQFTHICMPLHRRQVQRPGLQLSKRSNVVRPRSLLNQVRISVSRKSAREGPANKAPNVCGGCIATPFQHLRDTNQKRWNPMDWDGRAGGANLFDKP
jgi:hypothetical protein